MIGGILFDMDGVLFDTERPAAEADRIVAAELGYEMCDECIVVMTGANAQDVERALRRYVAPDIDIPAYFNRVRAKMLELIAEAGGLGLLPGVRQTLEWLRQGGYRLCVASSSPLSVIEENLRQSGLTSYFEATVGGDMVAGGKPLPDIFIAAAAALGLPPGRCVAVEDSYNGVRSASGAGCVTVMIPDMLPVTDEMRTLAAAVLPSLHALPEFLQGLGAPPAAAQAGR